MATESTANMNNSFSTAPVSMPAGGTTPVEQKPAQPANVDMTNTDSSEVSTPIDTVQTTPETGNTLDIGGDGYKAPIKYTQAHEAIFNPKEPPFTEFPGDSYIKYAFGQSIKDSDALTNSFKLGILRNQRDKNNFTAANQLFASLDNGNYKYSHHPVLGNIRIAIDATGKEIGLPEAIDKDGNPIDTTPNNLPDLLMA